MDNELETMRERLLIYANLAPLDLFSLKEIQTDLRAIAGQRHEHRYTGKLGDMTCKLCGRRIGHACHDPVGENR